MLKVAKSGPADIVLVLTVGSNIRYDGNTIGHTNKVTVVEEVLKRFTKFLRVTLAVIGAFCLITLSAHGEPVYPGGHNIASDYQLNDTLLALSDTLIISRMITNNDSYALTGLYISDNFPPAATIIDYDLQVGSIQVTPAFTDKQPNAVLPGYDSYWWQIDDLQNPSGVHDTVDPGETVYLTVRLSFDSVGSYSFPLHTVVFMGDNIPFFATGDTIYARTYIPSDVDDQGDALYLNPVHFEFSQGYPNPFNSSVSIRYLGKNLVGKKIELRIRNLLGQVVHQTSIIARTDSGVLLWEAPKLISSGVYFYVLTCQSNASTGKIVLIK